mgnify:CR=1 FL=1
MRGERQRVQPARGEEGGGDAGNAAPADAEGERGHDVCGLAGGGQCGGGFVAAGRAFVQPEQVAGVEERRTHDAEEEVGGANDAAAVVAKVQVKVAVAYVV